MKTCPLCGETYSERIDFCFDDGAVLKLMPSAMDAPVPRSASSGASTSPLAAPPAPRRSSAPPPVRDPSPAPRADQAGPGADATEPGEPRLEPPPQKKPSIDPNPTRPPPPSDLAAREVTAPSAAASPARDPAFDDPFFSESDGGDFVADEEDRRRAVPPWWGVGIGGTVLALLMVFWIWPSGEVASDAASRDDRAGESTQLVDQGPADAPREGAGDPIEVDETPAVAEAVPEVPEDTSRSEAAELPGAAEAPPPPSTPPPQRPTPAPPRAPAPVAPAPTPQAAPAPSSTVPAASPAPAQQPPPAGAAPAPDEPSASPWDAPSTNTSIGKARFTSDPSGAQVSIDGQVRGRTPLEISLDHGSYNLAISLDGYETERRRITVASSEPKFPASLKRAAASSERRAVLIVAPGWEGASLFVDGDNVGRIPVQVALTEGPHTFVMKIGDRVKSMRREVRARQVQGTLQFSLTD